MPKFQIVFVVDAIDRKAANKIGYTQSLPPFAKFSVKKIYGKRERWYVKYTDIPAGCLTHVDKHGNFSHKPQPMCKKKAQQIVKEAGKNHWDVSKFTIGRI
jgi:hypothetical protein